MVINTHRPTLVFTVVRFSGSVTRKYFLPVAGALFVL